MCMYYVQKQFTDAINRNASFSKHVIKYKENYVANFYLINADKKCFAVVKVKTRELITRV